MRKMFSRGVLSVAVCIGVGTGSLKADFDADLQSVLSIENRGFSEEVCGNPVHWIGLCDLCKAYKGLYGEFCKDVGSIVESSELTGKTISPENDPDVFAERAFCLLQLSRDLYGKVSEYAFVAYGFDKDDRFKNVEPLLLSECRYVFERRLLELSRFILRHHAKKFDLGMFIDTKDRKPDKKVLAEILKPFAKGDASEELQLDDNNSQLIQSLHVLSKVFDKFFKDNDKILKKVKEVFGDSLSSWFGVPTSGNETDYWEYVLECSEKLRVTLQKLSGDVWGRVDRMLSVKDKLSAELKKEALQFFKGEKDVGELLKAAESFRKKEKIKRQKAQKDFAEASVARKKLEREIIEKKEALKSKKRELNEISENGTKISDKKEKLEQEVQQLEQEVQQLEKTIETLKKQINKLSYLSEKTKRKMQRKAAKEGIKKEERDAAVFTNYVQLPGRCGAFLNAFLYYQTIMWNVFTDGINVMKGYGRKIYDELKIKEPELTDDFEEEYHNLAKSI